MSYSLHFRLPLLFLLLPLHFTCSAFIFSLPNFVHIVSAADDENPIINRFKCLDNGCCDQHEWCQFWASIGECVKNRVWMESKCQLACDTCPEDEGSGSDPIIAKLPMTPSVNTFKGICADIQANFSAAALKLHKNPELIAAVEDVSTRMTIGLLQVARHNAREGCVPILDVKSADCQKSLCFHMSFRSMDGSCNNLDSPLKGAAFSPYLRLLPAEYDDEISEPVGSIKIELRPGSRQVSRFLLSSSQLIVNKKMNTLVMQWGQFISHDMAKTTLLSAKPCVGCKVVPGRCTPIAVHNNDTNDIFKKRGCLRMSRSSPVCGTGQTVQFPRNQMNENTGGNCAHLTVLPNSSAFIDASVLYGSSVDDLGKFREGSTGFLMTTQFNDQTVLPFDQRKCPNAVKCVANFVAGDNRANIFLGLSSLHIVFVREHNRIATELQKVNPNWTGNRLFHETRKIVGAIFQVITYEEYLPKIFGSATPIVLGEYTGYDPKVDPSIANQFTSASFRFGHGMLKEIYSRVDKNLLGIAEGALKFAQMVFKSSKVLFEGGIDPILRGMMTTSAKRPQRITPAVTEGMFGMTDLASLNINRGRDHGLPSYNRWRQFCGFNRAEKFDDLRQQMLNAQLRSGLKHIYRHPGGMVGSSLVCLLGDQFKRLRAGDRCAIWNKIALTTALPTRFFYKNPGVFTLDQLEEIKKASLARVLCDNGDDFQRMTKDAFIVATLDTLIPCNRLPAIDLTRWKSS